MKIETSLKKKSFLNIKDFKIKKIFLFKIKISKKIHYDFIKFTGDNSPIHTNLKFCKKNNFKNLVGHAFLLTAILSKIYGIYIPGGTELCLKQNCIFKKPFFVNDELLYHIKIKYINRFTKILILSNKITNQKKEVIFEGESILYLNLKK